MFDPLKNHPVFGDGGPRGPPRRRSAKSQFGEALLEAGG